jgi:hypothetical protein
MRRAQLASAENRRRERVSCFEIAHGANRRERIDESQSVNRPVN